MSQHKIDHKGFTWFLRPGLASTFESSCPKLLAYKTHEITGLADESIFGLTKLIMRSRTKNAFISRRILNIKTPKKRNVWRNMYGIIATRIRK